MHAWRDYRGKTAAGTAASDLSDIENARKLGSVKATKHIASVLNLIVDDRF